MKRIIVIAPDAEVAALRPCFGDHELRRVARPAAIGDAPEEGCEFLLLDVEALTGDSGRLDSVAARARLDPIRQRFPAAKIIVMSSSRRTRDAVRFVKSGADDYLTYPIAPAEVRHVRDSLAREERVHGELDFLRERFWREDVADLVRTRSERMGAVFEQARAVAPTRTTVLLTGETGTGKNVLAKLIHQHSDRGANQFIDIHCGAIPETLLESELFGHEKGAFTGAIKRRLGKFEIAHGGTLLLDEIGTMAAAMQIRLLQVLQERAVERVGGESRVPVDVRVIAATNLDLRAAVESGEFRSDLFYRLNVFPIELPPLRERREDIPLLVDYFVAQNNLHYRKKIVGLDPDVLDALVRYDWPGNLRELESLMERAFVLERGDTLTTGSFPQELFPRLLRADTQDPAPSLDQTLAEARRLAAERVERRYLAGQLRAHRGRIDRSAAAAGITPRQLHKLMTKHHLRKETFKGSDAQGDEGDPA